MKHLYLFLKRIFDISSTFMLIVLLLLMWIIVPIIIKLDSKGPVFFVQERRGKNGKIFEMIKFRTMVVNAEKMGAGLFNYEHDNRVTKFGKFLRKTSIDELPQLFNIFIGTMSVVGPRPCVKNELGDFDTLNKKFKKRFEMKPGLTGLAQVRGRNNILWEKKVEYDNMYIDKFKIQGIFLDIKILFLSLVSVFKKENIYENEVEGSLNSAESARIAEENLIRMAHEPDEEEHV